VPAGSEKKGKERLKKMIEKKKKKKEKMAGKRLCPLLSASPVNLPKEEGVKKSMTSLAFLGDVSVSMVNLSCSCPFL